MQGGLRSCRRSAWALVALLFPALAKPRADPSNALYAAPFSPAGQAEWLAGLRAERDRIRLDIGYTGEIFDDAAVNWTRRAFIEPQIHVYDLYLYDPVEHRYTVDRYLEDLERRYGGVDSVMLWHTYPNIGIDARNQWDYYRALPGGLDGLRDLAAQFKARGVRVLWGYQPWDQGTRDEGEPHWETLPRLLRDVDADGFNGDTMDTMYKEFWDASVKAGYHLVGEMEGGGYANPSGRAADASWMSANWAVMGWGYYNDGTREDNITYAYRTAPGVDKLKWLDGRHMTHVCDRWAKNRTDPLHFAFFNGVGFESWENVWGMFVQVTPRDGEALRRVAALLRWLGAQRFIQDFLDWEPYTPDLRRDPNLPFAAGGLMASRFQHLGGDCVWLVVNRGGDDASAEIDTSGCGGPVPGAVYDIYNGIRLPGKRGTVVNVGVEGHGFAAVLATSRDISGLPSLLTQMQGLTQRPLKELSTAWAPLQQQMVSMPAPDPASASPAATLQDTSAMVLIPRTNFRFRTAGVELEGGCDASQDSWGVCCTLASGNRGCPGIEECKTPCAFLGEDSRGVDAQFPWEELPRRFHDRTIELGPFYIDTHLVTKSEFSQFLQQSGYLPRDPHNFLRDWPEPAQPGAARVPASGEERQPVIWVSLAEARSYCAWAGKRLPHTYEWQLAAQGTDGRLYPWGNVSAEGGGTGLMPTPSSGRTVPPLPNVGAFSPAGDSPFGVADLVGYVWQYTDEFRDEHTRTVLLKGSSLYTPMLSSDFPALPQRGNWYFPKALQVDRHNRMLLMDDSYERAGTLGFRCAADHPDGQPGPYHYSEAGRADGLII